MKKLLIILAILVFPITGMCADVPLTWTAVTGATSYKIQMSTDQGATWPTEKTTTGTTYTWLAAPDTGLVLFRAVAVNAQSAAIRTEAGAWYNGSWKPLAVPSKLGAQ